MGPARDALKASNEVQTILDDLGFDPFKDLDKMDSAGPGGSDNDKGLIIIHGRFNLDKFKTKGEEAAGDFSQDFLKPNFFPVGTTLQCGAGRKWRRARIPFERTVIHAFTPT